MLLGVLDGELQAAPPGRASTPTGPYRRGRGEPPPIETAAGEPLRVGAVLAPLIERQRRPRAYLQGLLRAEAARLRARPVEDAAERWGEELASVIQRRKWGPGRALLASIEEALAERSEEPSASTMV
jgi:hypothetical protein